MKVYLVVSGINDEYGVEAISLDAREAKMICATLNDDRDYDFCRIEERKTYNGKIQTDCELKLRFEITVWYKDLDVWDFDRHGYLVSNDINKVRIEEGFGENLIRAIATLPVGTTPEEAKRIMMDRIRAFKAEITS